MEIPAVVRNTTNYIVSESVKTWKSFSPKTQVTAQVIAVALVIFAAFSAVVVCFPRNNKPVLPFIFDLPLMYKNIRGADKTTVELTVRILENALQDRGISKKKDVPTIKAALAEAKQVLQDWGNAVDKDYEVIRNGDTNAILTLASKFASWLATPGVVDPNNVKAVTDALNAANNALENKAVGKLKVD